MAKALKTVGMVVGAVALVATGVGAAVGAGILGATAAGASAATFLGATAATWSAIGAVAGLAAAATSIASSTIFKPTFTQQGNPQDFQTNPQSGLPYVLGRTRNSGLRIFAETSNSPGYTKAQDLLWFAVLLSAGGQIDGIEKFTADSELVSFNPSTGNAVGTYANWMAQKVWTGGPMSSALALSLNGGNIPGWSSAHKLSGMTHALWGLRFDSNGERFSAGVPEPAWIMRGVKVYDPRLDSTYPGGSGPCRVLQENTYVWSRNPALHALTWALGRWQNGKRTLGIGAPVSTIRFADFVEAANIADANKWGCGGVEYSTDSKWQVFKRMLQSGGCVPTMTGAMIGCRVFAPRLSVATIRSAHLLDSFSGAATKPRRDRFNSVVPRYRSESHEWEVVSGRPVSVTDFVTQDGGIRQKEIDFPLVQAEVGQAGYDGDLQAGQLAAYEIVNSREAGPINFTTGPQFIGLRSGDCVTLDIPEEGYVDRDVIVASVSQDPATGKISFTAETETESKHAFALGQTAVPPPPFSLSAPDILPPTPLDTDWSLTAVLGADGLPLLELTGGGQAQLWDDVLIQYRKAGADWTSWGMVAGASNIVVKIPGVDGASDYFARVAYVSGANIGPWLELGPESTDPADILNPGNIPLGQNLIINSEFTDGGNIGWEPAGAGSTGFPTIRGINLNSSWSGVLNVAWAEVDATPAAGTTFEGFRSLGVTPSGLNKLKRWAIPVFDGERLYFGGLVAGHRCQVDVRLLYYAADGNVMSSEIQTTPQCPAGTGTVDGLSFSGGDPAQATRVGKFANVPAGARYAALFPRATSTGAAHPYMFYSQMFMAKVSQEQAVAPPYTRGPSDPGADKTGDNTANNTANVGGTPAATVEGGANAANNGVNADGTIKPGRVNTPAIVSGAVTTSNNFASVGGTSGINLSPNNWITVTSVTVADMLVDDRVVLMVTGRLTAGVDAGGGLTSVQGRLRILRDGATIVHPSTVYVQQSGSGSDIEGADFLTIIRTDTPGSAGSHSYALQFAALVGGGTGTIRCRYSFSAGEFFPLLLRKSG